MTPVEMDSPPPLAPSAGDTRESILCVDDDANILDALQRQFRKTFRIETALGPAQALALIESQGPFAVVVSDLRMPGMNGIQFLTAVRAIAPDTVRVMLTGQADLSDAIAAVNQGAIFRFLLKPSNAIVLGKVMEAALEQHRLIVAEHQLTRHTLLGCVEVLAEVLSIVEPVAFSRTNRVLRYVRQLAGILHVEASWQVEAAAMLSQIGWITIPGDIADKVATNQALSPEETLRFREHPAAAARMIEKIPRLQTVAKIIAAQLGAPARAVRDSTNDSCNDPISYGAAILRAAIDFDDLRRRGLSHGDAVSSVRLRTDRYAPEVIAALARLESVELAEQSEIVPLRRLAPGMLLEQDICGRNGMCLIGKGQQITATLLQRLHGFAHAIDPELTVAVRLPAGR